MAHLTREGECFERVGILKAALPLVAELKGIPGVTVLPHRHVEYAYREPCLVFHHWGYGWVITVHDPGSGKSQEIECLIAAETLDHNEIKRRAKKAWEEAQTRGNERGGS